MNGLLKRESTVRIISLLAAVFMWFFVLDSSNPITSVDYNIPLKIENENVLRDRGIVIKDKDFPRSVYVTIKGRKDKISSFNINDIEAVLDLSNVQDSTTNSLRVDVEVNKNKENVVVDAITPRFISLDLDKLGENPFPVTIKTTGKPKEKYKIIGVTAVPDIVSIEATDTIINSIGEVIVSVDTTNISRDMIIKRECKVYGKSGEEITEIEKKLSVDVKIEVAKEVPIVPTVKGKPAKNYVDRSFKANPDIALVTGQGDILNQLDNLRTEVVDIENISSSMTKKVPLVVPEGTRLVDTPAIVNVDVTIEELEVKEFVYSRDEIEITNVLQSNGLKYSIEDESIKISISGTKEELEKISKESIKPSIDVQGLGEGAHNITLKLEYPNTVSPDDNYTVKIKVEKEAE